MCYDRSSHIHYIFDASKTKQKDVLTKHANYSLSNASWCII